MGCPTHNKLPMTRDFLYDYMRQHRFAVLSTVSAQNTPESAYVGIAVTRELNIVFDTVSDSRKYHNLQANPHIAFVIGGTRERTLQYEGIATVPSGEQLDVLLQIYFEAFPDGKLAPHCVLLCSASVDPLCRLWGLAKPDRGN